MISITINGIDHKVVKTMQPSVKLEDVVLMGKTAAMHLIEAQMSGLKMAVAAGLFVKVNTVLAEGLNDGHMTTLARFLAGAGVGMMNIMPVVVPHSRSGLTPPDRKKVEILRTQCEKYLP